MARGGRGRDRGREVERERGREGGREGGGASLTAASIREWPNETNGWFARAGRHAARVRVGSLKKASIFTVLLNRQRAALDGCLDGDIFPSAVSNAYAAHD